MAKSYSEKEIQKIMHDLENYTKALKIGLSSCIDTDLDTEELNDYIESSVEIVDKLQTQHVKLINELRVKGSQI